MADELDAAAKAAADAAAAASKEAAADKAAADAAKKAEVDAAADAAAQKVRDDAAEAAKSDEDRAAEAKAAAEAANSVDDPDADKGDEGKTPADPKPLDTKVWGDTGNEVGNSVLGMLQESGIEPADAKALLFDAVQAGDVSKIDRAALEAKVGKNAANIIMSGTETFIKENASNTAAIISDVHKTAGGEDNWNKVSEWAAANVSKEDLAEYAPMIDKGGAAARFAVNEIMASYNADAKNSTIQPATPRAEATSVSPPAVVGTSRREYVAALEKAHRFGTPTAKELATITAQREAGRKQGK